MKQSSRCKHPEGRNPCWAFSAHTINTHTGTRRDGEYFPLGLRLGSCHGNNTHSLRASHAPSAFLCSLCVFVCLGWRPRCFISLQPFPRYVKSYWVQEQLYHLKPTTRREKGVSNTFHVVVRKPSCIEHGLIVSFYYTHLKVLFSVLCLDLLFSELGWSWHTATGTKFKDACTQCTMEIRPLVPAWLCTGLLLLSLFKHAVIFCSSWIFLYSFISPPPNCGPRVLLVFITKIFLFWSILHFEFQVSTLAA